MSPFELSLSQSSSSGLNGNSASGGGSGVSFGDFAVGSGATAGGMPRWVIYVVAAVAVAIGLIVFLRRKK